MESKELCVAICTPVYDRPSLHFWRALRQLVVPMQSGRSPLVGWTRPMDIGGYTIHEGRMLLTRQALDVPAPQTTHILWVDDDMVFPPHALQRLLSHDLPIVGGLCHSRRSPYHPILARYHDPHWRLGAQSFGFLYDYPPDSLVEVDATGAGFLLVKRGVFEKISEWAKNNPDAPGGGGDAHNWWDAIEGMSEDFSFCFRAREAGLKVVVDTGLDIGHLAEVVIDQTTAKKLRPREWARAWTPPEIKHHDGPPVASIVIPTFNQDPEFLQAAVLSAECQSLPVAIIVVDDGTTDYRLTDSEGSFELSEPGAMPPALADVKEIRLSPGVRVLHHQKNRGIAAALNTGVRAATTPWICWVSSDDMIDANKVERQLSALRAANAKAGFHGYLQMGDLGNFGEYAPLPTWRNLAEQHALLSRICCINGSTTMIHHSVFDEVGLFDESLRYGQDWEMWCRIGERHLWYKIEEILGTKRVGRNLTSQIDAAPTNDPRRLRRDEEDEIIKQRYHAPRCPHCQKMLPQ